MRVGDLVRLDCEPTSLPVRSPHEFLGMQVAGKRMLHVGAAGGVDRYLPDHVDVWAHAMFMRVAREVDAIDIDRNLIAHAARYGYEIKYANCETAELDKKYDAIVMTDVLEHVEQPPRAIVNMCRQLAEGGRLYVATPNGTYAGTFFQALLNRSPNVYWDHMQVFTPEHIQAICDRHGLRLESVGFYSPPDETGWKQKAKSLVYRAMTAPFPRVRQAFLAVIAPA